MVEEVIPDIIRLLVAKASRRSAIRYGAIYEFFENDIPQPVVWETFEEACRRIAPSEVAIYGCLLAKKDSGLPGDGFFDIFKNKRLNEYLKVTGGVRLASNTLSLEQMQQIAQLERERVHQHSKTIT